MLKELKETRQVPGEPPRRWFCDDYFELIVWLEPGGGFQGFQLCYDPEKKPRALTWSVKYGARHSGIDDGENTFGGAKGSPVLTEDGLFDAPAIERRFAREAAGLPADIRDFVLEKIRAYQGPGERKKK
ncbi:MAG TPA: hypothetical protein DDW67_02980 [Elusimicrobia bacterium]|jgi:hypothetical protein|nr:hypothetical protein [Elusimicrobiota bacterium]